MIKLTLTIERRRPHPVPGQAQQHLRRHLLPFAVVYGAVATTSILTRDQSMLIDFTRALARMLGVDLGH